MLKALPDTIGPGPVTALAPMQAVTDHAFMSVLNYYGCPDWFFNEYFCVHPHSKLEPGTLKAITENPTGRPVFAQMLGNRVEDFIRTAGELSQYPIAGIDLNLGCPAPKIYKRNAGGGLLRDPELVDNLLGRLRDAIPGIFSVKVRLGFSGMDDFPRTLESVRRHGIDLLSVHARTVRQMYRGEVDYEAIARAVDTVPCPVLANGNVTSATKAAAVISQTRAHGVMIGRAAIRNPWIFRQIRELAEGNRPHRPTLGEVRTYIDRLHQAKLNPGVGERHQIDFLKRFLVFIGEGVDPEGKFLYEVRRVRSEAELFEVCDRHLVNEGREHLPFSDEPLPGVVARPNREAEPNCSIEPVIGSK